MDRVARNATSSFPRLVHGVQQSSVVASPQYRAPESYHTQKPGRPPTELIPDLSMGMRQHQTVPPLTFHSQDVVRHHHSTPTRAIPIQPSPRHLHPLIGSQRFSGSTSDAAASSQANEELLRLQCAPFTQVQERNRNSSTPIAPRRLPKSRRLSIQTPISEITNEIPPPGRPLTRIRTVSSEAVMSSASIRQDHLNVQTARVTTSTQIPIRSLASVIQTEGVQSITPLRTPAPHDALLTAPARTSPRFVNQNRSGRQTHSMAEPRTREGLKYTSTATQQGNHDSTYNEELVVVLRQVLHQLVQTREEDRTEDEASRKIMHELLEGVREVAATQRELLHQMRITSSAQRSIDLRSNLEDQANLAMNYAKLMSLLAFAPDCDSLGLYGTRANISCRTARSAAKFALISENEQETMTFLTGASLQLMKDCALTMVTTGLHKTSPDFHHAWFQACVTARARSCTAALSTIEDMRQIRHDYQLPQPWSIEEEELDDNCISMSVCGFAFVIMKVSFDLRRKICVLGKSSGDMNVSHEVPWATEALRLDSILSLQRRTQADASFIPQISSIVFPTGLTEHAKSSLLSISPTVSVTPITLVSNAVTDRNFLVTFTAPLSCDACHSVPDSSRTFLM
eukprot:IDg23380t1